MTSTKTYSPEVDTKKVTIAVAGNPNSGKSTLINAIAGSRLQVGNWPGVTVEKKEALLHVGNSILQFVDLPGTYSLSPYSQEEIIARDFLVEEKPDVVVNVVDATNLERNLYLTVQILELGIPVIIALNMMDEVKKSGQKINIALLEKLLGVKVIPTVASRKKGTNEILKALVEKDYPKHFQNPRYNQDIEEAVQKISQLLQQEKEIIRYIPSRWLALKLIEKDQEVIEKYQLQKYLEPMEKFLHHLKKNHDEDLESLLADERYGIAAGVAREVVQKSTASGKELTEKIDAIVLNKYLGIPIFLFAMWLVFKFTFDFSTPFVDWIDAMTAGPFSRWSTALFQWLHMPSWFVSLMTDGVVAGVGFVLVFVPVIFAMMFFITLLESTGYMARAAFVMDRLMHSIGLHGKSFIPLLIGFGCNVPAIYATRTLENRRDRILTSLLIPFMSCGARLPVYALFISIFFPHHGGLVLWILYTSGIGIAILLGLLLKKTLFKSEAPVFIMELPPYRLPTLRNLLIHTWEKGKHFLVKAGTYILAVSVFVWFLLNLPWGVQEKKDSLLGKTAQVVAPVFKPLGFGNWEATASLMTGVIAKEIVVGTMGEIYVHEVEEPEHVPTLKEDLNMVFSSFIDASKEAIHNFFGTFGIASLSMEDTGQSTLKSVVRTKFNPLTAFSFMMFVLLYMPCIVTGIAFKQEFGTFKWYGVAILSGLIVAYSTSLLVYQIGSLLGFG